MKNDNYKKPKWFKKEDNKGYTQHSKDGFYSTKEWVQLAKLHKSLNPFCKMCEDIGRVKRVDVTDHIYNVENHPELKLDYDNLQSLCYFHHRLKTRRDNSKYNHFKLQKGKELINKFYNK